MTDIQERTIENPYLTDAMRIDGTGQRTIRAQVNLRTLMGGFCRFHGNEAQNAAAARFKALAERSEVGGARAVDTEKEPVDGGGINPDWVFISGAEARMEMASIRQFMGDADYTRFAFVVIGEKGPTPYTKWRMRIANPGNNSVAKHMKEVRQIADRLAAFLKLTGEGPLHSPQKRWNDGSKATIQEQTEAAA